MTVQIDFALGTHLAAGKRFPGRIVQTRKARADFDLRARDGNTGSATHWRNTDNDIGGGWRYGFGNRLSWNNWYFISRAAPRWAAFRFERLNVARKCAP
ncbi:hypothetical protein KBA01_08290 [Kozakia baliensis]|nr:hypothetical protein KBA01_08290 [Kozakia baliensis]